MAITSTRYVYVGAHVTERTKELLRELAEKKECSMSLLISMAVVEKLEREGYDMSTETVCAETSDVT